MASALSAELIDSPRCRLGSQLLLGQPQAVSVPVGHLGLALRARGPSSAVYHHLLHRGRPAPHPLTATDIPEHQHSAPTFTIQPLTQSSKLQLGCSTPITLGGGGPHSSPFKELKQDSPRGGQLLAQGGANRFGAEPRRRCFLYYRPALCLALKVLAMLLAKRRAAGAPGRSEGRKESTQQGQADRLREAGREGG